MVKKTASLTLSSLTCRIPNYKNEILKFAEFKNKGALYNKFSTKFLSYIPVDYMDHNKLELFIDFADEAFAFFKNKGLSKRKVTITKDNFQENPAITVFLINDNKPFIVDSLSCLLTKLNIKPRFILHPIINCIRDDKGELQEITEYNSGTPAESFVYMKVLGNFNQQLLLDLEKQIHDTLDQVDLTNNFWQQSLNKMTSLAEELETNKDNYAKANLPIQETIDFLNWTKNNNFTFLGMAEFDRLSTKLTTEEGAISIWQENKSEISDIINLSDDLICKDKLIILGKINRLSPVHRNSLIDYILIKKIDDNGQYSSGVIIFGLYSTMIYYQSIQNIPILRQKLTSVLEKSGFVQNGYNTKKIKLIIESLPREAIIQIDENDLYCMCLQMLSSMLSRKLKLFIQQDWSGCFINVLILLPRERLTPEVHTAISKYFSEKFSGKVLSDYITEIAEDFSHLFSTLAIKETIEFSYEQIEEDLTKLSTLWSESFYEKLCKKFGEYKAALDFKVFNQIFPDDYRHKFDSETALTDLEYLHSASLEQKIVFNLIAISEADFQLKIYSPNKKLALSDILPLIENLGFKAIDEQSFNIKAGGEITQSWIYLFILSVPDKINRDIKQIKSNVEDALDKTAKGLLSSDSLSKLIALSSLTWRQVKLLKAITRYLHQTGFTYGKGYVQLVLIKHDKYTELLVELFEAKFNPINNSGDKYFELLNEASNYLDKVDSSAEDKILRSMLKIIEAIVRTNYYQNGSDGQPKTYLSFKFDSSKVPNLPLPTPYAEIFVYANDFEGIHLRGGKVARGGIRWSDRSEDYRTEVLGLMKAQMTKNAVIVPVGSKGGFFVNFNQDSLSRQEYAAKVVNCYQNFLRGLLDLTDNIVAGSIVQPKDTIIGDEQDPYLVVAADKGTATFSDYANSVSAEYGFWLGDAFASGGSAGYDHKKMGITAKGAWISVQRHFEEMGVNVQKDNITVVGIGDMSGDVFGNGMLRSDSIKLVAAFNHLHIFIDPTPDPKISFKERLRLFNLTGSKWPDYDPKLISNGGGVFERSTKIIKISPEIKKLLELKIDEIPPDDLINSILKSKVDLLWNGGIGTYIKASTESHFEIGDKANDNLRCDAKDIKAKVIAEGGNLGVSQLGRIEYSKASGRINTDFIDNSAGVDCSDHEVNIKIALNQALASGKLTIEERNKLLISMTSDVEKLVLIDNYQQTQAITISQLSPALTVESFSHLISSLEEEKLLDRGVEFLPNNAELSKRSLAKENMTRPELAVLLSYSKMSVYTELATALLTEDKYFESYLLNYFPSIMQEQFREEILSHPLRREIIRTIVTNKIVNQLGGALINTIKRETEAAVCDIIRSYTIVCEIFNLDNLWHMVEQLPTDIDNNVKIDMFTELAKIMRRGSSWFLRNLDHPINIEKTINEFKEPACRLSRKIGFLLEGEAKLKFDNRVKKYIAAGIDQELADCVAILDSLVSVFDIIYVAKQTVAKDTDVAGAYFATSDKFNIDWLRKICEKQMDDSYWNRLSIQSLKDDLYDKQRRLLTKIIKQTGRIPNIDDWISQNQNSVGIFVDFVADIKLEENVNINMIILANKKFEIFLRTLG